MYPQDSSMANTMTLTKPLHVDVPEEELIELRRRIKADANRDWLRLSPPHNYVGFRMLTACREGAGLPRD